MDNVNNQVNRQVQPSQNNVVEIDLVSLMIYCLKKWRTIIVLMLIFAILLGGAKGAKGYMAMRGASGTTEESEDAKQAKETYENQKKILETEIDAINKKMEQLNTYMKNSVLYNMDKNNVYRGSLIYYIDTGYQVDPNLSFQNTDKTASVLKAYSSLLQSDSFYAAYRKSLEKDVDPKYLRELVNVDVDEDNHILTVSVIGSTQEIEHALLELVKKNMEEDKNTVAAMITDHTVSLVSSSEYKTVDKPSDGSTTSTEAINIADKQQAVETTLADYQQSLTDYTQKLSELEEPAEATVLSKSTLMKSAVKYAIIGLLLGLVLAVVIFCLQYAAGDSVIDKGRLEMRLRGFMPPVVFLGEYFKKASGHPLDKLAAKADGRKSGEEDLENVLRVAKANLISIGEPGRLLVTGQGNDDALKGFADVLGNDAKSIEVHDNIITDPTGIESLQNIDTAVLVVDKKNSKISNVLRTLQQLSRLGKRIGGIILV